MIAPMTIIGFSAGANPMNQPWSFPCEFCAVPVLPAIARFTLRLPRAVPCSTTAMRAVAQPGELVGR